MHRSKVGDTSLRVHDSVSSLEASYALILRANALPRFTTANQSPIEPSFRDEQNVSGYGGTVPGIALDLARHGNFEVELTDLCLFSPFCDLTRSRAKNVPAVNEDS